MEARQIRRIESAKGSAQALRTFGCIPFDPGDLVGFRLRRREMMSSRVMLGVGPGDTGSRWDGFSCSILWIYG